MAWKNVKEDRAADLAYGGVLAQAAASPRAFTAGRGRAVAAALRPASPAVGTAGSWGVEVTGEVAGMVRQWRIEGYSSSAVARMANRTLGTASGGDIRSGEVLCRQSEAVLGEDPDTRPWS